jgi:hypothetical protein
VAIRDATSAAHFTAISSRLMAATDKLELIAHQMAGKDFLGMGE